MYKKKKKLLIWPGGSAWEVSNMPQQRERKDLLAHGFKYSTNFRIKEVCSRIKSNFDLFVCFCHPNFRRMDRWSNLLLYCKLSCDQLQHQQKSKTSC